MAGAHAFLAPSSAARWVPCPASASLEAQFPETEDSPHAMEGTAAHWVNEQLLQGAAVTEGQLSPKGVPVTGEMLEGADLVLTDVRERLGPDWRGRLFIERRVQIPRVHATHNWGTPDYYAWAQLPDGRLKVYAWDYKFGYEIVEAVRNWQLIDYVAGILEDVQPDGLQEQNIVVEMIVVQPRAPHREGPVRRWVTTAADLRAQFNILKASAENALSSDPRYSPNPTGCKNCRGRHACEALQRAVFLDVDYAQRGSRLDVDPHALGVELRHLERAEALIAARRAGLEEQARALLQAGTPVAFWVLEQEPGRQVWTRPLDEVRAFASMMGVDLSKPADLITPTQAVTRFKAKGLTADLIACYAGRPSGSVKLRYDDGQKARLTFSSSKT